MWVARGLGWIGGPRNRGWKKPQQQILEVLRAWPSMARAERERKFGEEGLKCFHAG